MDHIEVWLLYKSMSDMHAGVEEDPGKATGVNKD